MAIQIPSPNAKKHARIEIIPLIDIVFFLLATFVMVSLSMVKNKGIAVHLPVAASSTPQDRQDFSTISFTEDGSLFFDKQSVSLEGLDLALREMLTRNADPRVFIHGDAHAEYGRAIEILDHVRRLGISKVAIDTRLPAVTNPTPKASP